MSIKDNYFIDILSPKDLKNRDRRREELISLGYTDLKSIDFLLRISYQYTPLGFGCFIAYFLQEHYYFKMTVQGGYDD